MIPETRPPSPRATVVIVGPDLWSQGGIASVSRTLLVSRRGLQTLRSFAIEFHASTRDGSLLSRLRFSVQQLAKFSLSRRVTPWILHAHMGCNGAFWRKAAYVWLSSLRGAKVVIQVHPTAFMDYHRNGYWLRRKAIAWTLRKASALIALTNRVAEYLPLVAGHVPCSVLHNPVDLDSIRASGGSRDSATIAFVGWLVPNKGVYELVDAIAIVRTKFPGVRAVFAGSKDNGRVQDYARARGVAEAIAFPGWLSPPEITALLQRATVLALPSHSEGLPMVIIEALACGTPIVTTPVGGIPEVLQSEVNAAFVRPGDVQGLATVLERILGDEGLRSRMSAANLAAASQFDVAGIVSTLSEIYESVLGRQEFRA